MGAWVPLGLLLASGAARAGDCDELLLAAQRFSDPAELVQRFQPPLGPPGQDGAVYRVEYAPNAYAAGKVYREPMTAREDQRMLDHLRVHAAPDDTVRIPPSLLRGRIMWLRYIRGRTLEDEVLGLDPADPRRESLLRAYHAYQRTELARQRARFGDDLEEKYIPHPGKQPACRELWWYESNLKFSLWKQYGMCRFAAHPQNVLVERGTDQLWLIDGR